ncbi:histidine--tRNA ligase [Candidatus Parcubacteria bacterium]|jgi:histidyl-tRNA synthetase|nr:MAG: histidine--tRNA ligase [Candidatus Parcubacteria bacterium]
MGIVEPTLPGGFKDYLPEDMIPRQRLFDGIRTVFERFGFVPLDTPCVERAEILTGGDAEFQKQIFYVSQPGGEKETTALRFDLTVPLARVVASYGDKIQRPFRRYQIGRLWRGERQQAGRYREFAQCDADIVGVSSMRADAEIIALMDALMTELGFKKFLIRINNRKILNGLSSYASFDQEKINIVIRIIDKLDKQDWGDIEKELIEKALLDSKQIEKIKKFTGIKSENQEDILKTLESLFNGVSIAQEGISELREIMNYLDAMGVSRSSWMFDLSVARGLGYYTGPVFETQLLDLKEIGSVFSGGRYDDLVSRFSKQHVPAVGASLGIDRLFSAMETLGLVEKKRGVVQALVLNFEPKAEMRVLQVVSVLRKKGINSALYQGQENTLKGQLSFAVKEEIPFVVIIGEEELSENLVLTKNLATREQTKETLDECIERIVRG